MRTNIFQRFWHRCRFREVSNIVEPVQGAILDVGCADGVFSDVVLRATGAQSLIGIDALETSVAWANNHWKGTAMQFQVGDAHHLSFPESTFAAAFCLEMLEHVFDPRQVLREMYRVLKPGGYAVVLVPTDSLLFLSIWAVWTRLRGKIWHETHVQSFKHSSLADLLRSEGFVIEVERCFLWGMLRVIRARKTTTDAQRR